MKKKGGQLIAFFIVVIVLAGLIGFTVNGIVRNIKLGLDLQGGFEVLYQVKPVHSGQKIDKGVMQATVAALRQRIDVIGVSEPRIDIEGPKSQQIRVQLAGVKDPQRARELLSTGARLSFRNAQGKKVLDGSDLVPGSAKVSFENNQPVVVMKVKHPDKFQKVTKKLLGKRMAIWMDYKEGDSLQQALQKKANGKKTDLISAPFVRAVLSDTAVISGGFKLEEAKKLAELLNAGSLPVQLKEIYSTSVGAEFGSHALKETVYAGAIAVALIFLFMLVFYRLPGVVAVIMLCAYMFLILLVYDWMNAVLTLAGIAAFVLGVGMAVDANVITYERIKEEIRSGKSILSAFKSGTRRSFVTILDANLTTILAGAVLYVYGTSDVKGFAVMLIVSIIASFITAVYGTRVLLGFWTKSRALDKKPGYFGVKEKDISDF
ncbi:MAG TPA: protein translocase subunit SecD [Bacillales bacterium]|nr:protein translocase subunit SecD [Bacillales bacterium]